MSADGEIQDNDSADEGARKDASGLTPGEAGRGRPAPEASGEKARRAATPVTVPGGVLPNKAAEDDPRRWGDRPDSYDHDAWLQEQKPPHWG